MRSSSAKGIPARVVSMPSWELFEQQDQAYRDGVLPPNVTARVSVEMGSVIGWDRYVGATGAKVGMNTFGSSAPLKDLLTKFGFTPAKVRRRREGADRKVQRDDMMNVQVKAKSSVNPLRRLHDYGQAVWLDFLSRRFHRGGWPQKAHRSGRAHRRHLQSLDLRKGHRRQRRLRFVAEGGRK